MHRYQEFIVYVLSQYPTKISTRQPQYSILQTFALPNTELVSYKYPIDKNLQFDMRHSRRAFSKQTTVSPYWGSHRPIRNIYNPNLPDRNLSPVRYEDFAYAGALSAARVTFHPSPLQRQMLCEALHPLHLYTSRATLIPVYACSSTSS